MASSPYYSRALFYADPAPNTSQEVQRAFAPCPCAKCFNETKASKPRKDKSQAKAAKAGNTGAPFEAESPASPNRDVAELKKKLRARQALYGHARGTALRRRGSKESFASDVVPLVERA